MASNIYAATAGDARLPLASTVDFPVQARRPVHVPVPDWREELATAAVEDESLASRAAQLRNELNRLAAEGAIRLELDGSGEHARLEVLVPRQRVTWERP